MRFARGSRWDTDSRCTGSVSIGCWGGERVEGRKGGRTADIPTTPTPKLGQLITLLPKTSSPLCQRIASARFPSLSTTLLCRIRIICCDLCPFFRVRNQQNTEATYLTTSLTWPYLHARGISARPLWVGKWEHKIRDSLYISGRSSTYLWLIRLYTRSRKKKHRKKRGWGLINNKDFSITPRIMTRDSVLLGAR